MDASGTPMVLEIIKDEQGLAISLYGQAQAALTVRHYIRCRVDFSEIEKLCADFSCLNTVGELKKHGQVLWDHLLPAAVKTQLKDSSARDLVLLIDEGLIAIPWELLFDGREFLSLRFNLGRLVRTHTQPEPVRSRALGTPVRMLILANPTNDLASAYREGLHIKDQVSGASGRVKVDFKSTSIDALYVKKNLRDYDIVHFAGHCEPDPAEPHVMGWVLREGRFTSRDIMIMGSGGALPALVFANSCHSAGDIDAGQGAFCGVATHGMASAFLFSGVRHYIGTIFKVEDEASRVFAKEFYRYIVRGEPVGECMRKARLAVARHQTGGALSWTSYILYGDPTFSLFGMKTPRSVSAFVAANGRRVLAACAAATVIVAASLVIARQLPTVNPRAYLLFEESQHLLQRGKNELAVIRAHAALKSDPLLLRVYPVLADSYQHQGDYRSAIQAYYQYAVAAQRKQDARCLADAYLGIGWAYQRQGLYPKALDFYEKALALSQGHRDELHEAIALRRLAVWHIDTGGYDLALTLLTKSSEINGRHLRDSRFRYNLACDYFDIGLVFCNKDDFNAARQFYQKSREFFGARTNELADYYFNLGEICLFEKQYRNALDYYNRGLHIDQGHGDSPAIASDYLMIGELYMEMGDLDKAESAFGHALTLSKGMQAPLESAGSLYNLGMLYLRRQEPDKARNFFEEALILYREVDTPGYRQVQEALVGLPLPPAAGDVGK